MYFEQNKIRHIDPCSTTNSSSEIAADSAREFAERIIDWQEKEFGVIVVNCAEPGYFSSDYDLFKMLQATSANEAQKLLEEAESIIKKVLVL
jgi:hypothetical protein